jgi:hypothetical protein
MSIRQIFCQRGVDRTAGKWYALMNGHRGTERNGTERNGTERKMEKWKKVQWKMLL